MNVPTWLDTQNIPYRLLKYPAHITTSTEAATFLGIEPEQMLKSLVVKVGQEFVMILIPLPKRLDMAQLMTYFSVNKARMATPDEVLEITGYKVGTVCPLLLPTPIRIFVDASVTQYHQVALSSGEHKKEIMLALADLQKLTQATILT